MNPAYETAMDLKKMLAEEEMEKRDGTKAWYEFYSSDAPVKFKNFANSILPCNINWIEHINIERILGDKMTKDVLITIAGMHTDAIEKGDLTDGPIEVVTPASYFCKNGKHYILYDEVAEGIPGVTKNKIKISDKNMIEIMKNGITNTHMIFEQGKKHLTGYRLHLDNL